MAKSILISRTRLYIINEVRRLRMEFDITGETIAEFCYGNKDSSIIRIVESESDPATYTDDALNCIAKLFSEVSGKTYTPADFYPKNTFNEELVPKKIIDLSHKLGPTHVINEILHNSDFLQKPRSTKEITTFANEHFDGEWNEGHFTSTAFRMSQQENNKLKRIDDRERVWYIDIAYFDDGKGDANKDG